jgi:hypothetical protein
MVRVVVRIVVAASMLVAATAFCGEQKKPGKAKSVDVPDLMVEMDATGKKVIIYPVFASKTAYKWTSISTDASGKVSATFLYPSGEDLVEYTATIDGEVGPAPNPTPTPTPAPVPVNPYTPTESLKGKVSAVSTIAMSVTDASNLAAVYAGIGKEAAQATSAIMTTADLRAKIAERGAALGLKGKYSGLAESIDKALQALFGLDVKTVDKATIESQMVTLAWAVWGAGR